ATDCRVRTEGANVSSMLVFRERSRNFRDPNYCPLWTRAFSAGIRVALTEVVRGDALDLPNSTFEARRWGRERRVAKAEIGPKERSVHSSGARAPLWRRTMSTSSREKAAVAAATITEHELRQVLRANQTGLQPVVFVHGLWLLPSSWERWAALF